MKPDLIYLVQTNTTVGFLSQNLEKLNQIKKRPSNKKFLKVVSEYSLLPRSPKKHRKRIRRTPNNNTYIINNEAYRVITEPHHKEFLKKFHWMYSSSANESGKNFDEEFAIKNADVLVVDKRGYFESEPSKIFKINKNKIKRLR
jgi:tRNA A37 threonylcarbamoyladenosine synthetase subunit TsaC/SUA5/YrdC